MKFFRYSVGYGGLFLALVVLFSVSSLGQDVTPSSTPSFSPGDSPRSEVDVLKAEVKEMKRSEDRIITTVFWALGVAAGVVFLLVGYSWFVNFRLSTRDKEILRDQLSAEGTKEMISAKATIMTDVTSTVEKLFADQASRLAKEFKELQRGVLSTMFWDLNDDVRKFVQSGQFDKTMGHLETMLGFAISMENDSGIQHCLDRMNEFIPKAGKLTAELKAGLNETLSRLPKKYDADRQLLGNELRKPRQ